jgi:light-regulated signal transduction histidine kinase (bacteriophytochrome)
LTFALLGALVAVYQWQVRLQRTLAAERDRQLAALETSNRELTRANDELDGFSYTVAHDLRAPVRALDSFAGLLGETHGKDLGDDGNELLKRIRDATARMEALIDGLLAFARLSRGKLNLREVDTANLVASVAAEVIPTGANIQLVVGALPSCHADPVMLRTVWSNLLANAVKYSRSKAAPRIDVGYAEGLFFVRDNGAGFDMAHAHNLFGAFQRLHAPAEFEGTGIGLAIVKRVVERHGGHVSAFGRVGEGAEFRFSLGEQPLAQATSPASAAQAP